MFDLRQLIDSRADDALPLFEQHVNPALAKVLRLLGYDVHFVRGKGQYLYDRRGDRYLDCLAGYGTFACGRNHPVIRRALQDAMDLDLPSLIKMGVPRLSGMLAEQLCQIAPGEMERVFFTNSGSESVETAIKFARAATGRERMLYCAKAFHGLTCGSLALNGSDEFRAGFGTLLQPVTRIVFNDLNQLEDELKRGDVAGFIVEPIQGKGVNMPDAHYLSSAARLCREHGALFIADEVQTGLGRTGKMFACQHFGVEPDIITIAKALSGGYVPVGAVLCKEWIHDKVYSSLDRCVVHSTTFGQNDLAMAAGLATLAVLREQRIVENAAAMGQRLLTELGALADRFELLREVRGKGLMIALEFGPPRSMGLKVAWKMIHAADQGLFPQAILLPLMSQHRILAQVAGHHLDVIKLLPSLVITDEDVDHLVAAFTATIAACHHFPGPVWQIAKRLGAHAVKRPKRAGTIA